MIIPSQTYQTSDLLYIDPVQNAENSTDRVDSGDGEANGHTGKSYDRMRGISVLGAATWELAGDRDDDGMPVRTDSLGLFAEGAA